MKWRASIVAADSNTVLAAVIPAHGFFLPARRLFCVEPAELLPPHRATGLRSALEGRPAASGGQLLLLVAHPRALVRGDVSPAPRLGGDPAAVGHPAVGGQPGTVPNDGTGADT